MQSKELLDQWPPSGWLNRRAVIAVSGGPDSVALLLAAHELASPNQILAAHFNHQWRGAASNDDQAWVEQLCTHLGVTCITNTTPTQTKPATQVNQSDSVECIRNATPSVLGGGGAEPLERARSEEGARAERYAFLTEVAYAHGASYVVTGHTADDRVETLLHNLLRGTGLAGAAALRMFRPLDRDLVLVRPMLTKSRQDVLNFLSRQGQSFRTDATNSDESFRRNFLRGSVLPLVQQNYPHTSSNLLRFAQLTEATLADLELLAERWLHEVEHSVSLAFPRLPTTIWLPAHYWILPRAVLSGQVWTVTREALRLLWLRREWPLGAMTHVHWESIRQQLMETAPSAADQTQLALQLPGGLRLEQWREFWAIGRPPITG